jgi:hypothetical protein
MRDESGAAANDYRLNARRSALLSVLAKVKNPNLPIQVNEPDVEGYQRVADVLETREGMFDALVALYGSLQAGMSYNAATETENAFTGFVASVEAYRKAVDLPSSQLADRPQVAAAGRIAGVIAEYLQKRNMVRASRLVSEQLPKVREALVAEQQLNISVRTTNALLKHRLADALRDLGLADVSADVDAAARLADTTKASSAADAYKSNIRVRQGFAVYNSWSDSVFERQLIASEYQKMIDGMDDLLKQHRRFEAGEPIDLGLLIADAERIKSISDMLRGKAND